MIDVIEVVENTKYENIHIYIHIYILKKSRSRPSTLLLLIVQDADRGVQGGGLKGFIKNISF